MPVPRFLILAGLVFMSVALGASSASSGFCAVRKA